MNKEELEISASLKRVGLSKYYVKLVYKNEHKFMYIVCDDTKEHNLLFAVFDALNHNILNTLVKITCIKMYVERVSETPIYLLSNSGVYHTKDIIIWRTMYNNRDDITRSKI